MSTARTTHDAQAQLSNAVRAVVDEQFQAQLTNVVRAVVDELSARIKCDDEGIRKTVNDHHDIVRKWVNGLEDESDGETTALALGMVELEERVSLVINQNVSLYNMIDVTNARLDNLRERVRRIEGVLNLEAMD